MADNTAMYDVTEHGTGPQARRCCRIVADTDPQILTRLIGLITAVNICPRELRCSQVSNDRLELECTIEALTTAQWRILLRKLSQPPQVWQVEDLSIPEAVPIAV